MRVLLLAAVVAVAVLAGGADYYSILQVPRDATKDQIRRAYKRQSVKFHPDKNPGDDQAAKKFVELANAYEVLSDDNKRRIYDQYGEEGLNGQQGGGRAGFHDPFDLFSQFFGGGGGRHRGQQERRGPDIKTTLDVTLEELYSGKTIEVELDKQILCPKCRGTGADDPSNVKTCDTCGGRGVRIMKHMLAPGFYQQVQQTCDVCGGNGKVIRSKCKHCSGSKVIRGPHQLDVAIERGMKDGEVITFPDAADQGPDYAPGDVKFIISTLPHPIFTRRGDNLYVKELITLSESLLGFQHTIKHLDGRAILLKRDGITPSGFVQTLKSEGMPHHQFPSEKGDLFVEYQVVFPSTEFSEADRDKIAALFGTPVSEDISESEIIRDEL